MESIAKIIMGIFAVALILDSAATLFKWTLEPSETTVSKPGFIETMSNKIVDLPMNIVGIVAYTVCKVVEGLLKMVFGMIPLLGSSAADKIAFNVDGLLPKNA